MNECLDHDLDRKCGIDVVVLTLIVGTGLCIQQALVVLLLFCFFFVKTQLCPIFKQIVEDI